MQGIRKQEQSRHLCSRTIHGIMKRWTETMAGGITMTTATTETQEARAAAFGRGDGLLAVAAGRTAKEGQGTRTEEKRKEAAEH